MKVYSLIKSCINKTPPLGSGWQNLSFVKFSLISIQATHNQSRRS